MIADGKSSGFNVVGTTFTWLDPDGVTLKTTDQFTVIYNDTAGLPGGVQSHMTTVDPNANYNSQRTRNVGATGNFRFNFNVPESFTGTLAVFLVGYPVSGAGGTGRDIDLTGEYTNSAGASSTEFTFSDLTSTYDTGTDDTRMELNITSLLPNITAGTTGGILVDHNSINGPIQYLGVKVTNS